MDPAFYSAGGLNVETYDVRTMTAGTPVDGDVEFYTRCARNAAGPVLELGAGTGRVSLAMAYAGVEVVGLDMSDQMLALAEDKRSRCSVEVGARVSFQRGNMACFELGRRFGMVVVPFRAFQSLIEPEEQRRSLHCIRRHLRAEGLAIIDLFDPRLEWCGPGSVPVADRETVIHPRSGCLVRVEVVERRNDPLRQILRETWRFLEVTSAGEILREEHETLEMRWTYRHEMRYLLELTGFEVVAEYSDFRESPPAYGTEQVWLARRR